MDNAKRDLVQKWLTKAQRDMKAAKVLGAGSQPLRDAAMYHFQQAAEKSIKGFLVFHDQRFDKTHDVVRLVQHAASIETTFLSQTDAADLLTPYAVVFRYPRPVPDLTQEECDQALQAAMDICTFVLSLLPTDVHPID